MINNLTILCSIAVSTIEIPEKYPKNLIKELRIMIGIIDYQGNITILKDIFKKDIKLICEKNNIKEDIKYIKGAPKIGYLYSDIHGTKLMFLNFYQHIEFEYKADLFTEPFKMNSFLKPYFEKLYRKNKEKILNNIEGTTYSDVELKKALLMDKDICKYFGVYYCGDYISFNEYFNKMFNDEKIIAINHTKEFKIRKKLEYISDYYKPKF